MNQAVQTAKRSAQSAASYTVIASKRGMKIATIAIARRPVTRACHLLVRPRRCAAPGAPA
jgi:hypothetical protein